MEKLKIQTQSKVDKNIEAIGSMFPSTLTEVIKGYNTHGEAIIEYAIDFDLLRQELSTVIVEGKEERYQMNWPGKKEAILKANAPINKTLRPYKEESVDFDNTENLYIEGDNLEVLKLLQETYLNKIKMIYIDPPYNTGNDSLVYNDDFTMNSEEFSEVSGQYDEDGNMIYDIRKNSESNGKFHTDWLNMMYPRLKLARDLLSDEGAIFISIDDNEVINLRLLCDEIFGAANFVAQITTLCNPKGRSQDKYFATNHEYIVIYSKYNLPKGYFSVKKEQDQIDAEYPEVDENGKYRLLELRNTHRDFGKHNRPNLFYPIYANSLNKQISLNNLDGYIKIEPIWEDGFKGCWTWDKSKISKDIDLIEVKQISSGQWKIFRKSYANGAKKMLKTIFNDRLFFTEKGQGAFSELFCTKGKLFQSPKSVDLIKQLIYTISNDKDIILDFFSGTSTTAHAVMQLNAEDGNNRKFIMVQVREETDEKSEAFKAGYKNICEIGKERIRKAGKKIREENSDKTESLDSGFRVLKVDTSNMKEVFYKPDEYKQTSLDNMEKNIKEDRSSEDLLFQVMLDLGELLSSNIEEIEILGKKVFNVGKGNIIACFDDNITDKVVTVIAKMNPSYAVFRDSSLYNDAIATNFEQIFKTYSPSTIRKIL